MKKLIKVSSASLALLSIFFIASCGDEAINTSSIIEDIEKGNFVWNEDNSASYVYKTANGEELTVTAKITSSVIKDATCIDEGQKEYKAEVEVLGKTYSDSKIITIPALGHEFDYENGEFLWKEDYTACKYIAYCKHDPNHTEETNCEIEEVEIDGKPHLKAKIDVDNQTLTDIVEKTATPRAIYYEKVEATCEVDGMEACYYVEETGSYYLDKECTQKVNRESLIIPATGHSYFPVGESLPTCVKDGNEAYIKCENCDKVFDQNYGEIASIPTIPALGHEMEHYDRVEPTHLASGHVEYNQCTTCAKYFDMDGKELETVELPKRESDITLMVNGSSYGTFTKTQNEENCIVWVLNDCILEEGDVISLVDSRDNTISYDFFSSNTFNEHAMTKDAVLDLTLTLTLNGYYLEDVTDYAYGLYIEITDVEKNQEVYPLNVIEYNYGEESHSLVFGYWYFNEDDTVYIKDTWHDITYGYSDIDDRVLFKTYLFAEGENNSIRILQDSRLGFEFDRNDSKKIDISRVGAPASCDSVAMIAKGEEGGIDLVLEQQTEESEVYVYFMNTLTHDSTTNKADILEYVTENGVALYTLTLTLNKDFKVKLKDSEDNLYGFSNVDEWYPKNKELALEGDTDDYIIIPEDGKYAFIFTPAVSNIGISQISSSSTSTTEYKYFLNGSFGDVTPNEENKLVYENASANAGDSFMFTNSSMQSLNFTLSDSVDSTYIGVIDSTYKMIQFKCTGVYTITLDLSTMILDVEVISIQTTYNNTYAIVLLGTSTKSYYTKTNPKNSSEALIQNVSITDTNAKLMLYNDLTEEATGLTLDSNCTLAALAGNVLTFTKTGTFNVYIDNTTYIVRVVEVV